MRLPTGDTHEFEPWSPVPVGAFLDHAATHRLGALFEVAVMTGLRRAELLGLRWSDVDLARRELTVRSTRVRARSAIVENSPKTSAAPTTTSARRPTAFALSIFGWGMWSWKPPTTPPA